MTTLGGLALATARRLDAAGQSLAVSMQRLSSGLRVNSARDDAAGLAIAERMQARERGALAAVHNANDAVSLVQTADGALSRVTELLQRLRELAVQSANGTLNDGDRRLLQLEADGLVQSIDRIGVGTRFNGVALLDGSLENLTLQVGAGGGDQWVIDKLLDVRAASLPSTGVSYSVNDGIDVSAAAMPGAGLVAIAGGLTVADKRGTPVDLGPIAAATTGQQRLGQIAAAINARSEQTGISAVLEGTVSATQFRVTLVSDRAIGAGDFGGFAATTTGLNGGSIADGPIQAEPLGAVDLLAADTARLAVLRYDKAIAEVTGGRARLGAVQSRLDSVLSQLQFAAETEQAARSRILDADVAAESAQRSRATILQQAGTAMLAQANLMPREVLQLLRGTTG